MFLSQHFYNFSYGIFHNINNYYLKKITKNNKQKQIFKLTNVFNLILVTSQKRIPNYEQGDAPCKALHTCPKGGL